MAIAQYICCIFVFLCCAAQTTAQNRVAFSLRNPQVVGLKQNTGDYPPLYYTVELWATVASGQTWNVGDCDISFHYNRSTLRAEERFYNVQPDPQLGPPVYDMYQMRYADTLTALSLANPSGRNFAAKTGEFRMATLRWEILTGSASDADNIRFAVPPTLGATVVFEGNAQQLFYNCNTPACFDVSNPIARYIFSCANNYNRLRACFRLMTPGMSSITPIDDHCLHWPRRPGAGGNEPYTAYYNTQLTNGYPTDTAHTRDFDPALLTRLMDDARCRWAKQLDGDFRWQPNAIGAVFAFSSDRDDFYGREEDGIAITVYTVMGDSTLARIVPTSECGSKEHDGNRNTDTRIAFNNTDAFYRRDPRARWTTDYAACRGQGRNCLDFYTLALHELGHFLGLGHERRYEHVMHPDYAGPKQLSLCEVNTLRRIYAPSRVGQAVDNSGCDSSPVEESIPIPVVDFGLKAYPSPIVNNEMMLLYKLPRAATVEVFLLDVLGNKVAEYIHRYQGAGTHGSALSVAALPSGVYVVCLRTDEGVQMQKVLVVR